MVFVSVSTVLSIIGAACLVGAQSPRSLAMLEVALKPVYQLQSLARERGAVLQLMWSVPTFK